MSVELRLARCTLRPYRRDDEPSLVRYASNRSVARNMRDRFPYPYTAADAREWTARVSAQTPVANFAIVVDDDVRRLMLRRFPYALLYRLSRDEIRVLAVMNLRRRPLYRVGR